MMERREKESAPSTLKRNEPTFVPEWLKATTGRSVNNGGSKHSFKQFPHSAGILSRNRLLVNACDPHSTVFTERSSLSSRRSSSSNGLHKHNKDKSVSSWSHSSGRSHHDMDYWDKDIDLHEKKKLTNCENDDDSISNRSEKDALMRSQSMISARRSESWSKRTGSYMSVALSSGRTVSSINKASFESEFPSLVGEDRQGPSDNARVNSPSPSSAVQSMPLGSSPIVGSDGWTPALVEAPVIIGGNGPHFSSVKQAAPAGVSSTVPSTVTGLNMAETLVQVPRSCAVPQVASLKLPLETQKLEELAIRQSRQLVPMTPSIPKASVLSSLDKPKSKGSRSSDFNMLSKVGQQSSPQVVNNSICRSSRPDILKPSQIRSFQVLNRKKNGFSPAVSNNPSLRNAMRVMNPLDVAPSDLIAPPLNSHSEVKVDGKVISMPLTTNVEKHHVSQQNRSDFFNSIRKMSASHLTSISEKSPCQSSTLEKSNVGIIGASTFVDTQPKVTSVSDSGSDRSMEDSNCTVGAVAARGDFESSPTSNGEKNSCFDPSEEVRLLQLFGWNENAGEEDEALTAEEIDAFIAEYQRLRPSSKFCRRSLRRVKPMMPEAAGSSG